MEISSTWEGFREACTQMATAARAVDAVRAGCVACAVRARLHAWITNRSGGPSGLDFGRESVDFTCGRKVRRVTEARGARSPSRSTSVHGPRASPDPDANQSMMDKNAQDHGEDPPVVALSLARRLVHERDEVKWAQAAAVGAGELVDAQRVAAAVAVPGSHQFRRRARRAAIFRPDHFRRSHIWLFQAESPKD